MKILFLSSFVFLLGGCNPKLEATLPPDALIDESVSGIFLVNPESSKKVLGEDVLKKREPLKPLEIANRSGTEKLELIHHPGDVENSFSEFHLRTIMTKESLPNKMESIENFKTGRGVHLGMSVEELYAILGEFPPMKHPSGRIVISFETTDPKATPYLKKVNMPSYEAEYLFKEDKLDEATWGLPYP